MRTSVEGVIGEGKTTVCGVVEEGGEGRIGVDGEEIVI